MCEGFRRAESEFLRGPREKESKFGDASDNYQLWSEAFEHSLSVLPGLSGINKIHALVSHTKGEARETVLLYKNCTRHGTAEIMFERAWEALRIRYGTDDILSDKLNEDIIAFKPLSSP